MSKRDPIVLLTSADEGSYKFSDEPICQDDPSLPKFTVEAIQNEYEKVKGEVQSTWKEYWGPFYHKKLGIYSDTYKCKQYSKVTCLNIGSIGIHLRKSMQKPDGKGGFRYEPFPGTSMRKACFLAVLLQELQVKCRVCIQDPSFHPLEIKFVEKQLGWIYSRSDDNIATKIDANTFLFAPGHDVHKHISLIKDTSIVPRFAVGHQDCIILAADRKSQEQKTMMILSGVDNFPLTEKENLPIPTQPNQPQAWTKDLDDSAPESFKLFHKDFFWVRGGGPQITFWKVKG